MRHNRIIMSAFQSAEQLDIVQEINRASNIETGAMVFPLPGESHYHRARGLPSNHLWTRIAKIDNPIRTTNKIKTSLRSLPLIPIHSNYMAVGTVAVRLKTTSALPTQRHSHPCYQQKSVATYLGNIAVQKAMEGIPGQEGIRIGTSPRRGRQRLMVSVGNRVLFGVNYLLVV
jgi:hypothetical protein